MLLAVLLPRLLASSLSSFNVLIEATSVQSRPLLRQITLIGMSVILFNDCFKKNHLSNTGNLELG